MRITKVYTKTGDKGSTALVGGTRVLKNHPRIDFYFHLDFPKPPKNPPKSNWDANKWGLERSLFRDAMQLARKSSQTNGGRRL